MQIKRERAPMNELLICFLAGFMLFAGPGYSYACGGTDASCRPAYDSCLLSMTSSEASCEKGCDSNDGPIGCLWERCGQWFDGHPSCSGTFQFWCRIDSDCTPNTCSINTSPNCNGDSSCTSCVNAANDPNDPFSCPRTLLSCKSGCQTQYSTTSCDQKFAACKAACNTYTITATAHGNGSIVPSGTVTVGYGGSQGFGFKPNTCYYESHLYTSDYKNPVTGQLIDWGPGWDYGGAGGYYQFSHVNANQTIDVYYDIRQFAITTSASPGGTITPSATVPCGSDKTVTITANPCYHITDITVDNASLSNVYGLSSYSSTLHNIAGAHTISATFSNQYTLTVNKFSTETGTGTVTSEAGINCGATCLTQSVPIRQDCPSAPSTVTLIASPTSTPDDSASSFAGWAGACTGTGNCTVTMNSDKAVAATFNILPPVAAFTASQTDGPMPLTANFTNQSVRAWAQWLNQEPYTYTWDFGDGTHDPSEIHLKNPTHIYRTVGIFQATLTVKNPSGQSTTAPVTIKVSACPYLPTRVLPQGDPSAPVYYSTLGGAYDAAVDGDLIQTLSLNLIDDITSNKAIRISGGFDCYYYNHIADSTLEGYLSVDGGSLEIGNFKIVANTPGNLFTIVSSAGFGGYISPAGTLSLPVGSSQTYIMTPDPGFFILDVLVDGQSVGPVATYPFTNLTENHTVEVVFGTNGPPGPPSTPDFSCSPTVGVASVTTQCSDLSTLNPIQWRWDFGDGTTSILINPTHTYNSVGTYTITLTVTNSGGTSTTSKVGYIEVQPYARVANGPTITYYPTLQAAYDNAPDGSIIQVRDLVVPDTLNAYTPAPQPPKSIILEGGYNSDYSSAAGTTTLNGSIDVSTDALTVNNITLQK